MRKILIAFLIVFFSASSSFAGQGCFPGMGVKGYGGCTASYGNELMVTANATDCMDNTCTGTGEGDAVTPWTGYQSPVNFDSIDTGTPKLGSYHIYFGADSGSDGVYRELTELSDGTLYKASIWYKTDGTNYMRIFLSYTQGTPNICDRSALGDAGYTEWTCIWIKNPSLDHIGAQESNAENTGYMYLDKFSVKAITPCYGSELYTLANAANPATETDATTGWTAINAGTTTLETSTTKYHGDKSIHIAASAAGDGAYIDMDSVGNIDLEAGKKYLIRYWTRHDGTGTTSTWACGFGAALGTMKPSTGYSLTLVAQTTYFETGWAFTHDANSRYFQCVEQNSGNNGGVYIDKISIKEITAE